MIRYLGTKDATTRCLIEEILTFEGKRADKLADRPARF